MPDDRTLVAAQGDLILELIDDRNEPASRHAWDEAWKKVAKGQVMLALETRWLRRRIAQGMPGSPARPDSPSAFGRAPAAAGGAAVRSPPDSDRDRPPRRIRRGPGPAGYPR